MWFSKRNQIKYYCVAGHTFQLVSALKGWEKALTAYSPFEVQASEEENRCVLFSVSIEKSTAIPSHRKLWEIEPWGKGTPYFSISSTATGYLITAAYLFHTPRRFYLSVNETCNRATLLIPPEFGTKALPDYELVYGINFLIMRLYALATVPYHTLQLHASSVIQEGKAYLFFGKSGTGKSTHSQLWISHIAGSELLNDDGPVVRVEENGEIRAYGSPWSGKTPCYKNLSAPVGAIVDLKQAPANSISQLPPVEAYLSLRNSASGIKWDRQMADHMDRTLVILTEQIPHYKLCCLPDKGAAELCATTVKKKNL